MYFTHTCTFIVQACSRWVVRPRYVHLRRSSIGTVTIPPHIQEMPKHTMRIHEIPPWKAFFVKTRIASWSSDSTKGWRIFHQHPWHARRIAKENLTNRSGICRISLTLGTLSFFFIRSSLSLHRSGPDTPKLIELCEILSAEDHSESFRVIHVTLRWDATWISGLSWTGRLNIGSGLTGLFRCYRMHWMHPAFCFQTPQFQGREEHWLPEERPDA